MPRCSRCRFHGKPLEAIPCLLAVWTFISALRPMAKTVVSAVKPGRQASTPCLPGFLVCVEPWCLGRGALYIDNGAVLPEHRQCNRLHGWHLRKRSQCVNPSGKGLCQITLPSGAQRHAAVFLPAPVKIVLLSLWPTPRVRAMAGLPAMCAGKSPLPCYPLDPCFHFSLATKCPTHLK